jgi:hypothetical protein
MNWMRFVGAGSRDIAPLIEMFDVDAEAGTQVGQLEMEIQSAWQRTLSSC